MFLTWLGLYDDRCTSCFQGGTKRFIQITIEIAPLTTICGDALHTTVSLLETMPCPFCENALDRVSHQTETPSLSNVLL